MYVFQGLTVVGHPAVYGSRTLFDQHRDMRLDIDNMSYEVSLILLVYIFSPWHFHVDFDFIGSC